MDAKERAIFEENAANAGLSDGAFIRYRCCGTEGPRAQRQISTDRLLLSEILGQVGKIGSNLNQIAKRANTDGLTSVYQGQLTEIALVLSDIREQLFHAIDKR